MRDSAGEPHHEPTRNNPRADRDPTVTQSSRPDATPGPPTPADVATAARRIAGAVEWTPLRPSTTLSELAGCRIHLKFENLQFTASFKERGALNRLLSLTPTERRRGVVALSAGNHAQGVARHAGRLGIPATIVMPVTTPFSKVRHTRELGAEVVLEGEDLNGAREATDRILADTGAVFIHPYDDPDVIAGQGTVGSEMLADRPDLDTLVVPVGGGGLMAGIALAAQNHPHPVRLIGVQMRSYPSMAAALAGHEAPVAAPPTIAEGIAVKTAGELTRRILKPAVDRILLVDEDQVEDAVALYADIEKTVVEGAGAAALAAVLAHPDLFTGHSVGLVVSGGNIDSRLLASVLMRRLVREGRLAHLTITVSDRPGSLAAVTAALAEAGASVVDLAHRRLATDIAATSTDLEVVIETRDPTHTDQIVDLLLERGFHVTRRPVT